MEYKLTSASRLRAAKAFAHIGLIPRETDPLAVRKSAFHGGGVAAAVFMSSAGAPAMPTAIGRFTNRADDQLDACAETALPLEGCTSGGRFLRYVSENIPLRSTDLALFEEKLTYPPKYKDGDLIPEWIVEQMIKGFKKYLPDEFDKTKVKAGKNGFIKLYETKEFDKDTTYGSGGPEKGGKANCGPVIQYYIILDIPCDEDTTASDFPHWDTLKEEYKAVIPQDAKDYVGTCDNSNCSTNKVATKCQPRTNITDGILVQYAEDPRTKQKTFVSCVFYVRIGLRCGCGVPEPKPVPSKTGHGDK